MLFCYLLFFTHYFYILFCYCIMSNIITPHNAPSLYCHAAFLQISRIFRRCISLTPTPCYHRGQAKVGSSVLCQLYNIGIPISSGDSFPACCVTVDLCTQSAFINSASVSSAFVCSCSATEL